MKKSRSERIIEMLLGEGSREVPSKSRKYRTFTRHGRTGYYFIGRNGALRSGETVSQSVSLTGMIRLKGDRP